MTTLPVDRSDGALAPAATPVRMAVAAALLGCAAVGHAQGQQQQQSREAMQEIVVTAQKREQSVQDVPTSITAVSEAQLRQRGIEDTTALSSLAPGLTFGSPVGAGNNPSFTLRGVGLNDFNDNNEGPVAVYVDEVYRASLAGQGFALFDVQRVEVLRGPQGTLYGRNATGGLMHVVTNKPTEEPELTAELTASRFGGLSGEFAASGPLGGRVQGRIAGLYDENDGWFENRLPDGGTEDRNETERFALRGFLSFDVTERGSVLVGAHYGESDVLAALYGHQGTAGLRPDFGDPNGGCFVPEPDMDCFGYKDTDDDFFAGENNRRGDFTVEASGATINASWRGDALTFTSVTGFSSIDKAHREDTDAGPLAIAEPLFTLDSQEFTQELRISGGGERTQWVGGVYYFDWDAEGVQQLALPFLSDFGITTAPFVLDTAFDQRTESTAAFGQLEFALTPTLTLRGGLRWTTETKEYDYIQVDRFGGVLESSGFAPEPGLVLLEFDEATAGPLAELDEDEWSGQIGLSYQPIDTLHVFANIARGFKSGGFNAGFVTPPPADPADPASAPDLSVIPYGNETLPSYELGVKWGFANGRAQLNATAFHYDYDDVQTLTFQDFSSFISNAASATIDGGEIELAVRPARGWDMQLGVSLLDSSADRVSNPEGGFFDDRQLVLAPDYTVNGLVRYEHEIGFGTWFVQGDFLTRGEHFFDIKNQPVARENGYTLFNARAGLLFGDGRYELALWGRNITDEEYLVYTFDFTSVFGLNQLMIGPPRWYGLTFSARL